MFIHDFDTKCWYAMTIVCHNYFIQAMHSLVAGAEVVCSNPDPKHYPDLNTILTLNPTITLTVALTQAITRTVTQTLNIIPNPPKLDG